MLPTIDADGLAAIALLRFLNLPFSIHQGASPSITSANQLPVISIDKPHSSHHSLCAGLSNLVALLTTDLDVPDPNAHLTRFQIAESTAFATMVTSRFGPARLYEFYIEPRNYADVYHTMLEKRKGFPLNRILPYLKRRSIRKSLQDKTPEAMYFDAGIALAALSTRLGINKWFYGDEKPSVLDAVVYGYLAPVLYVPLPSTKLRSLVAKHENLVNFVSRLGKTYFAPQPGTSLLPGELDSEKVLREARKEAEEQARRAEETNGEHQKEESEREQRNKWFLWGTAAVFAAHILLGNELEVEFE